MRGADDRLLRRQLDQKWRTLDQFEASLKKLETSKIQWRAKMAIKDGELEAAKVSLASCPCSYSTRALEEREQAIMMTRTRLTTSPVRQTSIVN